MIAENGEACGTAPEWVFPFHCIHSLHCRFPDKKWLEDIYPYLTAYLEWWFENRSDEEGWLHYLCSWESGQDESRRFGYQADGGVLVTQYRPVDLQASIAQACNIMSFFASELDLNLDEERWKALAEDFTNKTRSMWRNGWFRDYDSENGVWSSFKDTMQIAPVFCQIATDEQIEELIPYFRNIDKAEPFIWPTFSFVALESAWQAKQRDVASAVTYRVVDRVYRKWDRNVYLGEESLPGVSCEYWPYQDKWGSEGYGWGATSMVLLVRNIIGFRETQEMDSICFILAPCLPEQLLQVGKTYTIENLKYRYLKMKLSYSVEENKKIKINIAYSSSSNRYWKVEISDKDKEEVVLNVEELEREGEIEFIGDNGALYEVRFYRVERS